MSERLNVSGNEIRATALRHGITVPQLRYAMARMGFIFSTPPIKPDEPEAEEANDIEDDLEDSEWPEE